MYASSAVRALLLSTFSDAEIQTFCYDYFHPVYLKFSDEMGFSIKVQLLIEYCDRYEKVDQLLNFIKVKNPVKYNNFIRSLGKTSEPTIITNEFPKSEIELVLKGDFQALTPELESAIIGALAGILNISREEIRIVKTKSGSIVLRIEMPTVAIRHLINLYNINDPLVKDFGIQRIGPNPSFVASLRASINYWNEHTQNLDDSLIIEIDPDRQNLYEAINIGLELPETWKISTEVALQIFYLVERRGYWQEWLEVLNKALAHSPATAYHLQGQLLNRIGELHRFSRQLEEAIEVHKQAEALAQQQGDELALAEAHYRLCWDYLETREYAEAEQYSLSALETFTHLGVKDDLLTNTYWALGSIARRRGNITLALEWLTYAATLGRTRQQPTHLARILNELAVTLQEAASYQEALVCFKEALKVLESTASERDKVEVQLNMGVLFFRQQQWAKAEVAFLQAISSSYLVRSGEIPLQAILANNLGNVLLKQGRLVEAEAQLQHAWQLWLETQDYLSQANTMGSLAELYAKQGKVTKAVSLFKQAMQLLKLYPDDAFAQERLLPQFKQQLQALMN